MRISDWSSTCALPIFLTADLQRWARRYDVPLTFPSSFECGGWNTAAIFAARHGAAEGFVRDAYRRIWGLGIDPRDRDELRASAATAGLEADAVMAFVDRSEEHTSELQSLMRISYSVFCL